MFIQFLRENKVASWALAIIRIYLGYRWIDAGLGKLKGAGFDATGYLQGALKNAAGAHPNVQGWWATFLKEFAIPNVELFNFLVTWGEILVGIALIVGCFSKTAIFFALVMNFSYMFSGSSGINPPMIIFSLFILVAGMNAGKIGLDGFVLSKFFGRKEKKPYKEAA